MEKEIVQYSKSGWERSNYGGHLSLIYDHPFVSIGLEIDYEIKERMDLQYHLSNKLLDIFLLKVKENSLTDFLIQDMEIREEISLFGKIKKGVVRLEHLNSTYEQIIKAEAEYRALFEFYKIIILSTEISVPINEETNSSSSKGDSKKTNGKEKNKTAAQKKAEEKQDLKDATEKLSQIIKDITKGQERLRSPKVISKSDGGIFKVNFSYPNPRKYNWIPTMEQKMNAKRIIQMLDINFDPTEDRLNSLRNGKLDSRKVSEVIPGNMNVYYKTEPNISTKPFSVCILCDESGSMSSKIDITKNLVKTLYLAFSEIIQRDKLYIYGHSGSMGPNIYVYKDKYHDTFESTIDYMQSRYSNYDGPVIESIYEKIRSHTEDNIIFIILSDGQPAGHDYGGPADIFKMKRIIEKCRRDGFVTIGIGIEYFTHQIYDYSCIIENLDSEMLRKTSHIINKAVKNEFQ